MALSYQKATLYGNGMIDYVHIHNIVDTQEKINSTLGYTYLPIWDGDTQLLANFTSNINAGNTTSVTEPIINWWIYKKRPEDTTLTFVAKIPSTQNIILDYNVLNNTEYQYTIFAETENYLSAPLQSPDYVTTEWWNWSIVGMLPSDIDSLYYADNSNVWLFDSNLSSGSIEQNIDSFTFDNFTKYPKISTGIKNYISSDINALLSNVDIETGGYIDTVEMQKNFRDFIVDGNLKLLRDRKGNAWVVQTTASNMQYMDETSGQMTKVGFSFTQIDDYKNVNVIGG